MLDLRIPKPVGNNRKLGGSSLARKTLIVDEANGVGREYMKYADPEAARAAFKVFPGGGSFTRSTIVTLLADSSQTTPPLNLTLVPQPGEPSIPSAPPAPPE